MSQLKRIAHSPEFENAIRTLMYHDFRGLDDVEKGAGAVIDLCRALPDDLELYERDEILKLSKLWGSLEILKDVAVRQIADVKEAKTKLDGILRAEIYDQGFLKKQEQFWSRSADGGYLDAARRIVLAVFPESLRKMPLTFGTQQDSPKNNGEATARIESHPAMIEVNTQMRHWENIKRVIGTLADTVKAYRDLIPEYRMAAADQWKYGSDLGYHEQTGKSLFDGEARHARTRSGLNDLLEKSKAKRAQQKKQKDQES